MQAEGAGQQAPPTPDKPSHAPQQQQNAMSRSNSGMLPDPDQRRDTGGSYRNGDQAAGPAAVYQQNEQPRELFLRIRVQTIEKAKKDLVVRFDVITNLPHFRSSSYPGLCRSYRELCLYALALTLSSPATIVPALPLPSTTASGVEDTRILRLMLSRWFSRVLAEPHLRDNPETRNLVEADFAYSPTPPGAGSSSAARKRFANAMSSAASVAFGGVDSTGGLPNGVLATSASASSRAAGGGFSILGLGGGNKGLSTSRSVYDDDEELVAARAEVTRLEMQFADAAESSEKLAHSRRSLTTSLNDLAAKLNNLGAVEEVRPPSMRLGLPHALKRSAQLARNVGELQDALSNTELLTIGDAVAYQSINARAAKEAMLARNALVEEHHNAQKATINKKREAEHLKTQRNLRADKVDDALEDLEEAKRHEIALAQNLRRISANLHGSLQTHSRHAHHDIQQALLEHARGSLMYQKQMLKEIEALKPELWPGTRTTNASASVGRSPSRGSIGFRVPSPVSGRGSFDSSVSATPPPRNRLSSETASPGAVAPATAAVASLISASSLPHPPLATKPDQVPSRPNPWKTTGPMTSGSMTQSFHQPPPSTTGSDTTLSSQMAQSMFVSPSGTGSFASRFGILNSGTGGTASGRSRISASEAARSLAGKF